MTQMVVRRRELLRPQPVRAGVDPRNLLIDADPTNNLKNVIGPL
jgi:hypothetical protein